MLDIVLKLKKSGQLNPYINYIRFPYYKNLKNNLKIDFDYPLTAIVGKNGTNKSSILRAIWGCPEGNSLASFWFSTQVDEIVEDNGAPRYIYSYFQQDAKRDVEVIKTRMRKFYSNKDMINPEYWESARPRVTDKMEKMPKLNGLSLGRTKTRWNLMQKDSVYLDFRSEISAFDKFFYHGNLTKTINNNTKQDYIRNKSKLLKEAIDNDLQSKKMYRGNKEKIIKNIKLPKEQVDEVSLILGRNYSEIRLVEHCFFKLQGTTAIFNYGELSYSEAFAGSGEFSVVVLVNKVFEAKDRSLIILDEPEVSLHPGAQVRLLEFLLKRIKVSKHQVVIGTHSPFMLNKLPAEAIKTLFFDSDINKIISTDKTCPDEAFFHLEIEQNSDYSLFVEDRLAAEIVKKSLRTLGQAIHERFNVLYLPGGVDVLLNNYFLAYARTDRKDSLFILDGDQKSEKNCLYEDLSLKTSSELRELIFNKFNNNFSLPVDHGSKGPNSEQVREAKIKVLEFSKKYLTYLPGDTPESFIWKNMLFDNDSFNDVSCFKSKFEFLCKEKLGKKEYESVSSDEIFELQKRCLATVPEHLLDSVKNYIVEFIDSK